MIRWRSDNSQTGMNSPPFRAGRFSGIKSWLGPFRLTKATKGRPPTPGNMAGAGGVGVTSSWVRMDKAGQAFAIRRHFSPGIGQGSWIKTPDAAIPRHSDSLARCRLRSSLLIHFILPQIFHRADKYMFVLTFWKT